MRILYNQLLNVDKSLEWNEPDVTLMCKRLKG